MTLTLGVHYDTFISDFQVKNVTFYTRDVYFYKLRPFILIKQWRRYSIKLWIGCYAYVFEGRVEYVFTPPPLFCPTKFIKSSDQFSERKARRRRKNFKVTLFQKIDVFRKILRFLAVFNGFLALLQCLHNEKARRRRKIWEPLFLCAGGTRKIFRPILHLRPTKFSFWSDTPPEKIWR